MVDIGRAIKIRRQELEISQRELAREARTSKSNLCSIECGRYAPSLQVVRRMFEVLKLRIKGVTDVSMVDLGLEIYNRRIALGWTQEELALRSGYTQATISSIEAGQTKHPSFYTVEDILNTLGADLVVEDAR